MPKRPIVPEDLLRIQIPSDPQFSPDGSKVVFAVKRVGDKNNYISNLWLWEGSGEPRQITFADSMDTQPRWNPDGSGIAFASNRQKPRSQIYFLPLAGGEPSPLTNLPEGSLGKFEWSPDGSSIAFLFREKNAGRTKEEKEKREKSGASEPPLIVETLTWRYDGDGVFGDDRYKLCITSPLVGEVGERSEPGEGYSGSENKLYRVVVDSAADGAYDFCWSRDSKTLWVSFNVSKNPTMEPWMERLHRVDVCSRETTVVEGLPDGEFAALSESPDGKWLACAFTDSTLEKFKYTKIDLCLLESATGAFRNLTRATDYDLGSMVLNDLKEASVEPRLIWGADDNPVGVYETIDRIYFTAAHQGKSCVFSVELEGDLRNASNPKFGGSLEMFGIRPGLVGVAQSRMGEEVPGSDEDLVQRGATKLLIELFKDRLPEIQLSWSGPGASSQSGSRTNKEILEEVAIVAPEEHWLETELGVKVQTWVIKPETGNLKPETRLPCVIEVHGGPHAMYSWSAFFAMQLLAANGYVVVFSNPRGSTGYGEDFARCIDGDWGNKDWHDIQGVTKFAKSLPYVDPNRVAIMGGSYGGYMVNWAIGHSDEYKCAITDRCVSNLLSKSGNSDYTFIPNGTWPGAAYDDWEVLWDRSPVKHLKNCKTPTLVIHSEGDLRCNVEQGDQIYTFLKMLGVPTRYVRYPATTSHGMSRAGPPDLRIHRLKEILRWLDEWL